jgi:hypothetical protein
MEIQTVGRGVVQGPQACGLFARVIQFRRVLDAQHHRMGGKASKARLVMGRQHTGRRHLVVGKEPVRCFHFGTAATRDWDALARMLRQPFAHPDRPLPQSVIPEGGVLELAVRPTHCSPPASHSVSQENRRRTATSTGETQDPSSAHSCLSHSSPIDCVSNDVGCRASIGRTVTTSA